jgi:hypothetical protein
MKKMTLIFAGAMLILASCGSTEEKAKNKEVNLQTINEQMIILDKASNDFCECLETKSLDECNDFHLLACKSFDLIMANIDEMPKNGEKDPKVLEDLRNKAIPLFDKKANCAKRKMME